MYRRPPSGGLFVCPRLGLGDQSAATDPAMGQRLDGSLEQAKAEFREAWERFYATLTPESIAHWHHHQDAAKRSGKLFNTTSSG